MQFDMKQADFYFVDGYANTGAVNLPAGYAPGVTTMAVDGIVGIIPNGVTFTLPGFSETAAVNLMAGYVTTTTTMLIDSIASDVPIGSTFIMTGDTTIYTVTAVTNTLGATTSITFTPGLVIAATDDEVITFSQGVTGTVYSVTGHSETLGATTSISFTPALKESVDNNEVVSFGGRMLKMKVGDGTMSYDEKRTVEYKKDRGILDTVRLGDQDPMEVKFDLRWEFLRSDATDPVTSSIPSPEEILKGVGAAAAWLSTSPDPCEPYCVNIYVVYSPLCPGVKKETYLLQMFRYETLNHEFKQGMIASSGKCNVQTAVVTRLTNSNL